MSLIMDVPQPSVDCPDLALVALSDDEGTDAFSSKFAENWRMPKLSQKHTFESVRRAI